MISLGDSFVLLTRSDGAEHGVDVNGWMYTPVVIVVVGDDDARLGDDEGTRYVTVAQMETIMAESWGGRIPAYNGP
jgi:hypothetical protein